MTLVKHLFLVFEPITSGIQPLPLGTVLRPKKKLNPPKRTLLSIACLPTACPMEISESSQALSVGNLGYIPD